MMNKVLFVCLGNICRSPAAEAIFRKMVESRGVASDFEIDSAGTYGGHRGERSDGRMRSAGQARGYVFDHLARQVCQDDFDRFETIVAMDQSNYEDLCRLAPSVEARAKVCRMADFSSDDQVKYIPDPYYEGIDGFNRVLDLLEDCLQGLFTSLDGSGLKQQ